MRVVLLFVCKRCRGFACGKGLTAETRRRGGSYQEFAKGDSPYFLLLCFSRLVPAERASPRFILAGLCKKITTYLNFDSSFILFILMSQLIYYGYPPSHQPV